MSKGGGETERKPGRLAMNISPRQNKKCLCCFFLTKTLFAFQEFFLVIMHSRTVSLFSPDIFNSQCSTARFELGEIECALCLSVTPK